MCKVFFKKIVSSDYKEYLYTFKNPIVTFGIFISSIRKSVLNPHLPRKDLDVYKSVKRAVRGHTAQSEVGTLICILN